MTQLQKQTVSLLLKGGSIAVGSNGFRVRNAEHHVEWKINSSTFYSLRYLLRKTNNGLFIMNKSEVRKLHGGTWIKMEYKRLFAEKKEA